MLLHYFLQADGRLVKLSLFSTVLEKSPLTSIYFTTFEKKRKVRSPLPRQSNFLVNICSYLGLLKKDKLIYWKHTKFKKVAKSLFLRMQTLSGTEDWYPANYNIFEVEAKKAAGILQGESGFF